MKQFCQRWIPGFHPGSPRPLLAYSPGPGSYKFSIGGAYNNRISCTRAIPAGTSARVDIDLPGLHLEGRIHSAGRASAAGIEVSLQFLAPPAGSPAPQAEQAHFEWRRTKSDEQGRYRFEALGAGLYLVRLGATMPRMQTMRDVTSARMLRECTISASSLQGIDFELERPGAVEGDLRDADGRLVSGATVHVLDAAGHPVWARGLIATDATGHYRITGLAGGQYTVYALRNEQESERVETNIFAGRTARIDLRDHRRHVRTV